SEVLRTKPQGTRRSRNGHIQFHGDSIAKASFKERVMLRITKILVPTDFSACSEQAVKYASELALSVKAKLYVLHVAEHSSDGGDPDSTKYIIPEYISEVERSLKERLAGITNALKARGLDAEPVLLAGRAYADIVKTALDLAVDLIVIST